jgi:hypothetical protein
VTGPVTLVVTGSGHRETITAAEWDLIKPVLEWVRRDVGQKLYEPSGLVSERFADAFSMRLRVFHALHSPSEAMTKKAFEFAFEAAAIADGHYAAVATSATTAASDITVDGVGFSLKTEASKDIKSSLIVISKLMESAWTKACPTIADFISGIKANVIPRLRHSARVFLLRAHGRLSKSGAIRYELVEIPVELLLSMENVRAADFKAITKAKGTSCPVYVGKDVAYTLVFDGSDQKITIRNLSYDMCTLHAEWTLSV